MDKSPNTLCLKPGYMDLRHPTCQSNEDVKDIYEVKTVNEKRKKYKRHLFREQYFHLKRFPRVTKKLIYYILIQHSLAAIHWTNATSFPHIPVQ